MTIVKWTPINGLQDIGQQLETGFFGAQLVFREPTSLLRDVGAAFSSYRFWKCPAVTEMCKNTFVIRAPFDMTVHLEHREDGTYHLWSPNVPQHILEKYVFIRPDGTVTLPPSYLFYADEPLIAETFPVPFFKTSAQDNTAYIVGTFDIGRWIRPVDFAFMVLDMSKPVVIKEGDPLFCMRFLAPKDSPVKLVRVPLDEKVARTMTACLSAKDVTGRLPLDKLYELAAPLLRLVGIGSGGDKPK